MPQSASSRLPGIGVEQLEGTKGDGARDSGRLEFWGRARVLDLTGEEVMELMELLLDLSFPVDGDLSRGAGVGGPCSTSSGIGLGGGFFFPFGGLLLFFSFPAFCPFPSELLIPTSFANQRHLSINCSCMRLMQVDSSAIPGQGKELDQLISSSWHY